MRILVLGGTTEASALARLLAEHDEIDAMLSLAGRTASPRRPPIPFRVGGFGGVPGLVAWLRDHAVDAVVDATHPFAEQMSHHAVEACRVAGIPLLVLTRPPWTPVAGDRWEEVADAAEAAARLGSAPRRVLLTVGRLSLPAFEAAPQHVYVVRSIDPPDGLERLPNHRLILARGPFSLDDERDLLRREAIEVVVSKNSGGDATAAKLAAAREAGLRVVMIRRPSRPEVPEVQDPAEAVSWILSRDGHAPPP